MGTDGGVSRHVVAVVKADEGQVRHMGGEGQDQQDSQHAGHTWTLQAQGSNETLAEAP